jgi:hypothetical protein
MKRTHGSLGSISIRRNSAPKSKRRKYEQLPLEWIVQHSRISSPEEYVDNWIDEYYIVQHRYPAVYGQFKYTLEEFIIQRFMMNEPNVESLQELTHYIQIYLQHIQTMIQEDNIHESTRKHLVQLITYHLPGHIYTEQLIQDIQIGAVPLQTCAYLLGLLISSHTRQFLEFYQVLF